MEKGVTALHEVLESYIGGLDSPGSSSPTFDSSTPEFKAYKNAHDKAVKVDSRYKEGNIVVDPTGVYYTKFPYDPNIPKNINTEILINNLSK